jgi:DNA-binding CsgD family transcriptional regulator
MDEERTEMERYKTSENKEDASLALTEREKQILRLVMRGAVSDYQIARLQRIDVSNVARSRKNALRKIGWAQADLEFVQGVGAAK